MKSPAIYLKYPAFILVFLIITIGFYLTYNQIKRIISIILSNRKKIEEFLLNLKKEDSKNFDLNLEIK
jgi:hypothetical protein